MALTVRQNGKVVNGSSNLVSASWWNDYHDLLTGVMTDQPVKITYTPGNNTNAVLALQSGGTADALRLYKSDGTTVLAVLDANGNLTVNSIQTAGGGLLTSSGLQTVQSGATALGVSFKTWDGAASHFPFSIGGQFNAAPAFVDNAGNLTVVGLTSSGEFICGAQNANFSTRGAPAAHLQGFYSALDIYCDSASGMWSLAPSWGGSGNARGLRLYGADASNGIHAGITIDGNGGVHIEPGVLQSGGSFMGFKDSSGNKIGEMKNGTFIIGGHAIGNGDGTGTTTFGSSSFDSFDVAELYPTDQVYASGTVVCPDPTHAGTFTRCTHDACAYAMIVSGSPGVGIGQITDTPGYQYLALAGRMLLPTSASTMPVNTWVTSDGTGGVRAVAAGETNIASLGFVILPPENNQVGILVRPVHL